MSKENLVKRSVAADADLDDFVTPRPSKKPQFAKPLSEMQMEVLEKGPVAPNTDKSTV